MPKTTERSPLGNTANAVQGVSGNLRRDLESLTKAMIEAQNEFWTGVLKASANASREFSEALDEVSQRVEERPTDANNSVAQHLSDRMEDVVNTAEALTRSTARGMKESSEVVNKTWDGFARHYRTTGKAKEPGVK